MGLREVKVPEFISGTRTQTCVRLKVHLKHHDTSACSRLTRHTPDVEIPGWERLFLAEGKENNFLGGVAPNGALKGELNS